MKWVKNGLRMVLKLTKMHIPTKESKERWKDEEVTANNLDCEYFDNLSQFSEVKVIWTVNPINMWW